MLEVKIIRIAFALCLLALTLGGCSQPPEATGGGTIVPGIPVRDTVTLVDLGAKTCLPCTMMAPLLVELRQEYQGRAAVLFIDVNEQPEQAKLFKVAIIPTQIVYDRQGREVYRHAGFLDKKAMQGLLERQLAGR